MKTWYVASGFDSPEEDSAPWNNGIHWDEVNLFVTLNDRPPKLNDDVVIIGYNFDGVVNSPAPQMMREWPKKALTSRFFHRLLKAIFEVKDAPKTLEGGQSG